MEKIEKIKINKIKELEKLGNQKLEIKWELINEKEEIEIAREIANTTQELFIMSK